MKSIQERLKGKDFNNCSVNIPYKVDISTALKNDYILNRMKQYGVPYDVFTERTSNSKRVAEYWKLVTEIEDYLRNGIEPPINLTDKLQLESVWYNNYIIKKGNL